MSRTVRRKKVDGNYGGCEAKQKFNSYEAARKASKIPGAGYMSPYWCRHCGYYHFGHPRKK